MTPPALTQSRLHAGLWEILLEDAGATPPVLTALHDGQVLSGLRSTPGPEAGSWRISLPIPPQVLTEGLQTIVIAQADGIVIASLPLLAGAPLAQDLRAEISLLRGELDLLKSAFRRMHHEK